MIFKLVLVLSITLAIRAAEEVCYNRLGCFTSCPPYSGTLARPISHLPWAPEVIDTRFLLFTRANPYKFQVISALNVTSVFHTNFISSRKSIFIIHGFVEMGDKLWLVEMCQDILELSDVNCFCVDWKGGSFALYTQASNNVRVVGAEIAHFLNLLQAVYNYDLNDVHLIGHSLGAHVAGEAGKRQRGIRRISGLDPAGPYFADTPANVRLDPTDAVFVDAIHTDGSSTVGKLGFGGYGMMQTVGNVDFYPNGGETMPGCDKISHESGHLDELIEGLIEKVPCNHQMSVRFYTESILRPNGFIGYPASSYDDFKRYMGFMQQVKLCFMGYRADEYKFGHDQDSTTNQKFFLNTGGTSDFMRWRYRVTVRVAVQTVPVAVNGTLGVLLCGKKKCTRPLTIHSGLIFILSSKKYTSVVDAEADAMPVETVIFSWEKTFPPLPEPSLGASSVTVQFGPNGQTFHFCGRGAVMPGTNQTLELCPKPFSVYQL
uniref:Triacylglycerol lipase n=1 Tax=Glandirana rugosa TaxID=8410 RepID=A8CEP5_GLARU|nr:protein 54 [Glandirana rugosa]